MEIKIDELKAFLNSNARKEYDQRMEKEEIIDAIESMAKDVDPSDGETWFKIADTTDIGNFQLSKKVCLHFYEKAAAAFLSERLGYELAWTYIRMANDYDVLRGLTDTHNQELSESYKTSCFEYWGKGLDILNEMYGKDSTEYRKGLKFLSFLIYTHPDYFMTYESWLNWDSENYQDVTFFKNLRDSYSHLLNHTGWWAYGPSGYEDLYPEFKKHLKIVSERLQKLEALESKKEEQQLTYEEENVRDFLTSLNQAYESMMYRIHFKKNHKYDRVEDIYYIGFDDMSNYRYCIRARVGDEYDDTKDPIVATYNSMKEILMDGWCPD